jgi:hypothetical protein
MTKKPVGLKDFKIEMVKNKLIRDPNVIIPEGINNYGMVLREID